MTVIVGHASSGKSNFFDALINLSIVLRGRVGDAFSPYPYGTYGSARSWAAATVEPIGFEIDMHAGDASATKFEYSFYYKQNAANSNGEPTYQIVKEVLSKGGEAIFKREDAAEFPITERLQLADDRSLLAALRASRTEDSELGELAKGISRVGKYRLEPSLLSRPSNVPPPPEDGGTSGHIWLDYRGDNLASVLFELNESHKDKLDAITSAVSEVFPEFEGFSFNFIGEGRVGFSAVLSVRNEPVLAPLLSHGMLLFIGLMTLLHTPNSPDVILLEEPENGLDAKAIRRFYQTLVDVIGSPNGVRKQVVLSSHSPYVLCEAWNGATRSFIYHMTEASGRSTVRSVEDVMRDFNGTVSADGTMSIRLAERIMSERWT